MSKIINPQVKIVIKDDEDITIENLDVAYDIYKDLDEEPNTCELVISNLTESTRQKISNTQYQSTPCEIYLTASGTTFLTRAFVGEINTVNHFNLRPGYETTINLTAQKDNHRLYQIDKEFAAGTDYIDIINYLIAAVNLPSDIIVDLPTSKTILSQTLSGSAFQLLKKICDDCGLLTYINDGVVFVTWGIGFNPANYISKFVSKNYLLQTPETLTRVDSQRIEMLVNVDVVSTDPFKKTRYRNRDKKTIGENDFVSYSAVDTDIKSVDFELLLDPGYQPDDIVTTDYPGFADRYFRVMEIEIIGDNFGAENTTTLHADEIEKGI